MRPDLETLTVSQQLLVELDICDYLTASQAARLLEKERSLTYIREQLRALERAGLAMSLESRVITMPRVYTPTKKGREYASLLCGTASDRRFRPAEERDKARNEYFITHTLAVSDVLIASRLLAKRSPAITLTRMFTERQLRRQITVSLPEPTGNGTTHIRPMAIEPDASCDFLIQKAWQNFVHIEVYRNLPPVEWRFKQKIQGYVTYAISGLHEQLFQTPSLSIAVIATSKPMTTTLKRWTEEALQESNQPEHGELFFFTSVNPAIVSPEELYLSPVWEQAFSSTKTPLLVLE
jgi:Replication-relaxation